MARVVVVVVVGLFILAVAMTTRPAGDGSPFKITTKQKDDRVDVKSERNKTIISIDSPFGISQAVIERRDARWPDAVTLWLHLKGLEHFRVANGRVKLEGSVSAQRGKPSARLWLGGDETTPLDRKSPYWLNLRIIGGDGAPATDLPLKDGYFELPLPRAFFESDPKSITVDWIDFHRN